MKGFGGFLLLVLVIFTVARCWLWIGLAVAIAVLLVVLWRFAGSLDRRLIARDARRAGRAARRAAIAARADEQNRLFLAGDQRGIYGDYRPKQFD
jgi:FtsH-binding integral membrane protein